MIDTDAFVRSSPYKLTHGETSDKFNLNNTTSDLLKFQLQEQYRTTLNDLKNNHDANTTINSTVDGESSFLHSQSMQDFFNNVLQTQIEAGEIRLSSSTGNLSTTSTTTSTYVGDDNNPLVRAVGSGISGDDVDEDEDDNLDSFISTKSNKPNYLNLKILIENSIFDSAKIKSSILDFHALNELKLAIENKQELQQYLLSKITTARSMNDLVVSEHTDNSLLVTIIKTQSSLQSQLIETSTELEKLKEKLFNHYFSCLSLGYIEDIRVARNLHSTSTFQQSPLNSPGKIPNNSTSPRFSLQLYQNFDSLIAHIASVAAQRNITLPQPPLLETGESKVTWIQLCIDSILSNTKPIEVPDGEYPQDQSSSSSKKYLDVDIVKSNSSSPMRSLGPDKIVSEYKTALNDLKFSYEYLAKEYEMSKISSDKVIHDYRKKITELEQQLQSKTDLMTPPETASFGSDSDSLENKDKEISRLRKELNMLKIDKLGKSYTSHHNASTSSFLSSPNLDFTHSAISPITGESLNIPDSSILMDADEDNTSINSHGRPSSSGYSNGILRKEFKKIVSDIQDQYELELAEERVRRRKLEEELEKLKH